MAQTTDAVTVRDRVGIFTIRSAKEEDLPRVLQHYRSMHVEYSLLGAPKVSTDAAVWETAKNEILLPMVRDDWQIIFVAFNSVPAIVGFALGQVYTYAPPYVGGLKAIRVGDVFVHRSVRGGTLAVKLQQRVVDWGKSLGCTSAEASYIIGNRSGLLLEREGYTPYSTEVHKAI